MEEPEFKSHIQLSAAERARLLSRLDASARPSASGRESRREKRWSYRAADLALMVEHPGGGIGRFLVCSRNLSAGGIGFIHGGFLHPGTECRLLLRRHDGSPMALAGQIAHCRHLSGRHHEIGIQFSEKIDPEGVLGSTVTAEEDTDDESIELPSMHGTALIIDESLTDRRLLRHQLQATGLGIQAVDSPAAGLAALQHHKFSLVIYDPACEKEGAPPLVERIRNLGYRNPIIVLTAEDDQRRLAQAATNLANDLVSKPYSLDTLLSVLGSWLGQHVCAVPVYSSFADRPEVAKLIPEFIKEAERTSHNLEKAIANADVETVRSFCRSLSGSGSKCGFDAVTTAAQEALKKLDATDSIPATRDRLQHLMEICRCLRYDSPTASRDTTERAEDAA